MRPLTQFTRPATLRAIGHIRVAKFLDGFSDDLRAANVLLPAPPDPAYANPDPANGHYLDSIAAILAATALLPERVRTTLVTLEEAASPANQEKLQEAIQRRIPYVGLAGHCALDCALELWFSVPEEISQFAPPLRSQSDEPRDDRPRRGELRESLTPREPVSPMVPPAAAHLSVNPQPSADSETFTRLAQLSPAEYDRVRDGESKRLGIRRETLDAEVAKRRPQVSDDAQGSPVELRSVEPWPEPVDGQEALSQVSERFALCLVLPPGAADAIALWTAHAHAVAAFVHTPRLNLSSPEPECGKTTTLDLLATMTPRPLRTENITAPVLFRLVDQYQPTLLLDEVDSYLNQAEELRGLLNAGHKRGACAYRCEGEGNAVRAFKAFGPAVLAGIGPLPGTLHDRSIVILLLPAEADQLAARFDDLHVEVETALCGKLARWTQDNFAALQACEPKLPATAFNRLADNWRPLFAIAQTAGGDWPQRALDAFTRLTAKEDLDAQGIGMSLLADIRQIFTQTGATRIASKQLVEGLCALPGGAWLEARQGKKPITEAWLAHRLRHFGVNSRNVRLGGQQAKGYELRDFAEAFGRLAQ